MEAILSDPTNGTPRGLGDQLRAMVAALRRLVLSHVELGRAEFDEIMAEVGRVSLLIGVALGALLLLAILAPVGLILFLGEWVFGSIGWGLLLGTLALVAVAVEMPLIAFAVTSRRASRDLGFAVLVGLAIGAVLGLDLMNRGWQAVGDALFPGSATDLRALLAGVACGAIIGGLIGFVAGARSGGAGGAVGGLIGGALCGAAAGAFTAIAFGLRVGAALGVAAALVAWPTVTGIAAARGGIDTEAIKARFWPSVTIETAKETIEWVREQTPLARKS